MTIPDKIPDLAAKLTLDAFDEFNEAFGSVSRRARKTFENKDWHKGLRDVAERLDLYKRSLEIVMERLRGALPDRAEDPSTWIAAKRRFAVLIADRDDIDRAETFFNSVTRKMLVTVGINREVEFFYLHPKQDAVKKPESVYRTFAAGSTTNSLVRSILEDFLFSVPYEDISRDADRVAREIDLYIWPVVGNDRSFSADIVKAIFYRNTSAYIVGRIVVGTRCIPLILPLVHGDHGIYVDAVLLHDSEVRAVFSFAYSYFHVDVERYDALVEFLGSIMPGEKSASLYTSLGHNRHGKTEFYRDLHRFVHLSKSEFVPAPGLEGSVMIVFTLPNYDFVFKVIKDRPCFLRSRNDTPKAITKAEVEYRYDFVSHRDRAGRMVDTQEFENLRFKKKRFSEEILREFLLAASGTVEISGDYVILRHVYVQRKVVPLPMYFNSTADPERIRHVLIDFGYFLKDLAASGVFPCDLFNIWNYGVTDWGRVVLFDYDDVVPLEKVTFREKPSPRDAVEELEPEENWIVATDEDFFVDEIDRYSGIPLPLKGVFKSIHGDLYTLKFWENLTAQVQRGEVFDVIPYNRSKRFNPNRR